MAEKDIVQNLISRLGQSQDERAPRELDPSFAPIDARSPNDLFKILQSLAGTMPFYASSPNQASGTWANYFPSADVQASIKLGEGTLAPHLGLLTAFLKLYEFPQRAINQLTAQHLDFHFQRVLGFTSAGARPDRTHVVLELKKGAAPIAIGVNDQFSAGKDATKVDRIYQPVRSVVVGSGRIAELKSVFRDGNRLCCAPIANSTDGLGGALAADQPMWPPFGGSHLPDAHPGFALASPLLRLAEGERRIRAELVLSGLDVTRHTASGFAQAFEAFLTGDNGWLGPFTLEGDLDGNRLSLKITVPESDPAVVGYVPSVHGQAYASSDPILHLQLRDGSPLAYGELANLTVVAVRLSVKVDGLTSLQLESDTGTLNPKRAFLPFGSQPVVGSRFMIGCEEALSKRLLSLSVALAWQGAPEDLGEWYVDYADVNAIASGVATRVSFEDRDGQVKVSTHDLMKRVNGISTLTPTAPPAAAFRHSDPRRLYALQYSGSGSARQAATRFMLAKPLFRRQAQPAPEVRSGFISLELEDSFLHAEYRKETITHAVNQDKIVLNEPYTPTIQSISLSYEALSDEVNLEATDEMSFGNLDVQFFHVGCFGQMREHGFLRSLVAFLDDHRVTLLPSYPFEGECLVGISSVKAGDSISMLAQVAEGSADPDLSPQPLQWWVLCDNYWLPLDGEALTLDASDDLRTSGVLAITLPKEASTENSLLPAGLVWIRATVAEKSAAACNVLAFQANAAEVQFSDRGNDRQHLAAPLAAGSITKIATTQPSIKKVTQPYASVGGAIAESSVHLRTRASERLRHRGRAVTVWDYERLVLDAFPSVHRVKCIPHAREGSWLAPGHLLVVVVADLRGQNAVDPLQPRADIGTLTKIRDFLSQRSGMQVEIAVRNPFYQPVRLEFKVAMRAGYSFNYYSTELQRDLIKSLSPWAFDVERRLEFGGIVYRSVVLDVIEELPYVDFVTEFRMSTTHADGSVSPDLPMIRAESPDAILVSHNSHLIAQV